MDQVGNNPAVVSTAPTSSTWESYYKDASRRRRANGGRHHLRAEKRRRRWRERIGIAISAVVVGAMTLAFYLVLTR
jgi:hypothetical protein